ncbi:MAG: P pilus assembly protein, chaperone PapD [Cyanobacteria bacterium P01_F01_bin.150]
MKRFAPPKYLIRLVQSLGIGGIVGLSSLWANIPAFAQVGLSPLVIEVEAERGQAQGTINVVNNTSEPFRARVYVEPFTYEAEEGFQILENDTDDLSPYLQFSPRELEVAPNTTRRVRFVSRFPPSLPEGEYRAVIFTENLVETIDGSGTEVTLRTRVGSTVYVRHGEIAPNLVVDSARVESDSGQLQLLVQNTGQASIRPAAIWQLKQGDTVIESGETGQFAVLAESERYFRFESASERLNTAAPGQYQLEGSLVWRTLDNEEASLPFAVSFTIPGQ